MKARHKNDPQFVSTNIVNKLARKNTRCYRLRQCPGGKSTQSEDFIPQSQVYSNSFFPNTIRDCSLIRSREPITCLDY